MESDNTRPINGNLTPVNEVVLLRLARAGDRTALEILFTKNNRSLCQRALRLLGNREDAEDALQEGMLAAYRNLRHFEGRSRFSTWLTRIVINAALMRRRSRRRHASVVSFDECDGEQQVPAADRFPHDGPSPEQIYASNELSERLLENVKGLSPVQRRAFELCAIAGLTADEASKTLGVSRSALKTHLCCARRQLATRPWGRNAASSQSQAISAAVRLGGQAF